jgi:nicotinamide mononucleotide (NMN) deamidase PncC
LGVTGVAGPESQDGQRPGTVFLAVAGLSSLGGSPAGTPEVLGAGADRVDEGAPGELAIRVNLPGDRQRIRQFACISLLDLLRRRLLAS